MRTVINALAGLIFGLGLLISGMANPAKVQNFLDLAGTFDPSLIFVMVGAIVVTLLGYRFAFQRPRPILAERFSLATAKDIDARLISARACSASAGACQDFALAPPSPRFRCSPRARSSLCPQCSSVSDWRAFWCREGRPEKPSRLERARPSNASKPVGA